MRVEANETHGIKLEETCLPLWIRRSPKQSSDLFYSLLRSAKVSHFTYVLLLPGWQLVPSICWYKWQKLMHHP